ncbi:MarR family transcriptional regulator [Humibacter sp. BT305]|nr:MarR family transcriptional regulator [Humibacter sp. BT305]
MNDDATAPDARAVEGLGAETRQAIAAIYRRFRRERSGGHLGDGATAVLELLVKYGPLGLSDLSGHERVALSTMSQTVNRLEAGEYVERTRDPHDGRRVLFVLTDAGRALGEEGRAQRHRWFDAQLQTLTAEEREALATSARILQRIARS